MRLQELAQEVERLWPLGWRAVGNGMRAEVGDRVLHLFGPGQYRIGRPLEYCLGIQDQDSWMSSNDDRLEVLLAEGKAWLEQPRGIEAGVEVVAEAPR